MQINYLGEDKLEIITREGKAKLATDKVDIDDFLIEQPGEFERKGVFVEGIKPDGEGLIFSLCVESISLCYLGGLKSLPTEESLKEVGDVDILFVPLGAEGTIGLKEATKLISIIDPRIVIPIEYADISEFKKSEGFTGEELPTLKIKKSELPEEERKIYILAPRGK